ncbi:HvfC/BufC N-terminal domain-containing protein [Amorphus orientalis]|uniref:Putative DNA-binding domain-containing protein n=1 Tax=Amorphus orientalis TaxID=649198 RepID=A0AAE3VLG3_9HYPH|nr:DNA-binding domain-containing protein [Amorphus orientalis]MDQ0314167.1 hypothetical protein [Amorphus orientalis]
MPSEPDASRAFFTAVTAPEPNIPEGVVGPDGQPDGKRFGVYRNTVASTLTEALSATFPAVVRLVGEEFFAAAARAFASEEKPASPLLFRYGAGFPDFLARLPSLAPYPYIPDVARLDWAWLQAYHAADEAPLDPSALAGIAPDRLDHLRLALHPAAHLIVSPFPAVTIWEANRSDGPAPERLPDGGEDALVTRPDLDVEVRRLPPGAATLLSALDRGLPLGPAATAAVQEAPDFDLAASLSVLLGAGALAALRPSEAP